MYFIEAILTYGVTYILGTGAARVGLWHSVFGRKISSILLVSIPIQSSLRVSLHFQWKPCSPYSDNLQSEQAFLWDGWFSSHCLQTLGGKRAAKGVLQMTCKWPLLQDIEYGFSAYTNFHFGAFGLRLARHGLFVHSKTIHHTGHDCHLVGAQ